MIYLDHAATSKMLDCVKRDFVAALDKYIANPSSLHSAGHIAKNKIEEARTYIADLINADPSEIIFTSGGTESNNTIMHTFAGQKIAFSAIEHPSVSEPAKAYASNYHILPVDSAGIVLSADKTSANLVSIMLANNETGVIQPLSNLSHPKTTFVHSDITQAIGKIPIDVKKLNLDYATFTAHKIGGPQGIGAIYVKNTAPIKPLLLGGHQEKKLRAGTYNVPAIIGFGSAAKYAKEHDTPTLYTKRIRPLRNYLAKELSKKIPNIIVNTPLDKSLPNILNISFPAAEGESIQLYLDLKGAIEVSTGSACASGFPSHVLMAMHDNSEIAHSSIRFSLNLDTTKSDTDKVISLLPDIVNNLRSISTIKPKGIKND